MVKVFMVLAGNTLGAHTEFMETLGDKTSVEQVNSAEECDVTFTFCPIVSRVGTDVEAAVKLIPSTPPHGILIALHPTFDPEYVVPDTSRFVPDPFLAVNCLFHEGELLNCYCNDDAFRSVCNFLKPFQKKILPKQVPRPRPDSDANQSLCQRFTDSLLQFKHPKFLLGGLGVLVVVVIIIVFVILHASHAI